MVRIMLVVLGMMHWLLVVSMLMQMRFAVALQHKSMIVIMFGFRVQYLQLLLGAANLDGLLDQMLILVLNVDGHGMIVMEFNALMRCGVLVVHLMMYLGLLMFRLVLGVLLMLVLVNLQRAAECQQCQTRKLSQQKKKHPNTKQKYIKIMEIEHKD